MTRSARRDVMVGRSVGPRCIIFVMPRSVCPPVRTYLPYNSGQEVAGWLRNATQRKRWLLPRSQFVVAAPVVLMASPSPPPLLPPQPSVSGTVPPKRV